MQTYASHKTVKAAKITSAKKNDADHWSFFWAGPNGDVEDTTTDEETPRFKMSDDDLGYVVEYADGYRSWSPTKAFEEGYARPLQPHQQRVIDEHQALCTRFEMLKVFTKSELFMTLPEDEQSRLYQQIVIMEKYILILQERVEAWI